ncbi:Clp protease N-terminal domain-containing protein [Deinococcus sp.]|uniref:Clp protease N-terminal domain-containing protein n=1 Tax=Deinococcus sp. TaxID=47478 RepID=UPI003CC50C50
MNRYDDEARLIFHYAREEANHLGHVQVGPEHLLLGMMRGKGGGREILQELGASLDALRQVVSEANPSAALHAPNDAPSITPLSRRVMEQAAHEARTLGAAVTSSHHILLALLEVDSPVLRQALSTISLDLNLLRQQAEKVPAKAAELAEAQEDAGQRAQQQAMAELLDILESRSFAPVGGQSRAELLSLLLQGAAPALLPRLEELAWHWLRDDSVPSAERREIVHLLVSMALNRPR